MYQFLLILLNLTKKLILINEHIQKNNIKTKVVECSTIREKNGVACSTRNFNLNNKELLIASNIYKYLLNLKKKKLKIITNYLK